MRGDKRASSAVRASEHAQERSAFAVGFGFGPEAREQEA